MDQKLVAWGRAVKARNGGQLPPLWLFTDQVRVPDVAAAIAALPAGLCGVVFRHDDAAGRQALLRRVGRLCRARRLALVVAGDAGGTPAWGGRHLRGGAGRHSRARLVTSSAHNVPELVRARRTAAALVFLSPVFATESHAGARTLGPVRWAAMARAAKLPVFALGGVSGATVARLPRSAAGVGAIGALLP